MTAQYADDRNLHARQRLWEAEDPPFDLVGWVLGLVNVNVYDAVLDVGCGPGRYLRRLRDFGVIAVGLDQSLGIVPAGEHPLLVNGDAASLPFADDTFDVVFAPHVLYHVDAPVDAAREIRRVLRDGGTFVAVTNGAGHTHALTEIVERSVREVDPEWKMRSPAAEAFSLENGSTQLRCAFESVTVIRPENLRRVALTDPGIAADYVASVADSYEDQVSTPWSDVVDAVYTAVGGVIERDGVFVVEGDPGAFVCR